MATANVLMKPTSIHYLDNVSEENEIERPPDEMLLYSARHGEEVQLKSLFEKQKREKLEININCKGTSKANLGWTALHLASYFGHTNVVLLLLQNGADVNVVNDVGDTPLHRAAHTGRLEVVLVLLRYEADVTLRNSEGVTAGQLAKTEDIKDLIRATETYELKRRETQFLRAARDGNADTMQKLLGSTNPPNINCTDAFGNTALHNASQRGKCEVITLLLQNGCMTTLKNSNGDTAYDLARDGQTARLLDVMPIKQLRRDVLRFEGALGKKSRFIGWKTFWVVLDKGVLSFFRNRADATTGSRRRGFRYLDNARVECQPGVGHVFTIYFADESKLTFAVDINLNCTVNRQKWENALEEHIDYATQFVTLGWEEMISDDDDVPEAVPLGSMQDTLREAEAYQATLEKQVSKVNSAVQALAADKTYSSQVALLSIRQQLNCVVNTSQDMCSSLYHCLTVFTQEDQNRKLQLKQESEKVRVLQASLRVLAQEHLDLEQTLGGGHRSPSMADTDNEDEFFDCNAEEQSDNSREVDFSAMDPNLTSQVHALSMNGPGSSTSNGQASVALDSQTPSGSTTGSYSAVTPAANGQVSKSATPGSSTTDAHSSSSSGSSKKLSKWGSRTVLPVPMFSRNNFSVWTFLRQCVGQELSKITMPVIFNEPLSFLQRMTEYMEYSSLLQKAATCNDPVLRFEHVVAFAVSSAASNWERLGKPFNPLLGETYELDRWSDLGFKYVSEQVCHHPPVSAFHVTSPSYTFQGSINPKLKFWGKSVEVTPKGLVTLHLKNFGESYTWQNVNCCIHNIIVGKLWIEHYGTMEIVNQKTKAECVLKFKRSGWFGKDLHKVEGFLYDQNKRKVRAIYGKWVEALYSYDIDVWDKYISVHKQPPSQKSPQQPAPQPAENDSDDDPMPVRGSSSNLSLKDQRVLWVAESRPVDSEKYYNFTHFAMMLNERRDDVESTLAPTDSRLRPDMRHLEQGDLDGAAAEKHRLEEKQRGSRKDRKKSTSEWQPRWFKQATNPYSGKEDWVFTNTYWNRNWSSCPDIF